MDNDEQRDIAEELDNAMIPFRENMVHVFPAGWKVDSLLIHLMYNSPTVEEIDGEIVLRTGLIEAPDRSLWCERTDSDN